MDFSLCIPIKLKFFLEQPCGLGNVLNWLQDSPLSDFDI